MPKTVYVAAIYNINHSFQSAFWVSLEQVIYLVKIIVIPYKKSFYKTPIYHTHYALLYSYIISLSSPLFYVFVRVPYRYVDKIAFKIYFQDSYYFQAVR